MRRVSGSWGLCPQSNWSAEVLPVSHAPATLKVSTHTLKKEVPGVFPNGLLTAGRLPSSPSETSRRAFAFHAGSEDVCGGAGSDLYSGSNSKSSFKAHILLRFSC